MINDYEVEVEITKQFAHSPYIIELIRSIYYTQRNNGYICQESYNMTMLIYNNIVEE